MTDQKQKPAPLQEWQRDAIAAEPRGFMQDIIQAFRQRSHSASLISPRRRSEDTPRPAGGGTIPIAPPPGINIIDQMCEAQDRRDRAAAIREKLETEFVTSRLETKK